MRPGTTRSRASRRSLSSRRRAWSAGKPCRAYASAPVSRATRSRCATTTSSTRRSTRAWTPQRSRGRWSSTRTPVATRTPRWDGPSRAFAWRRLGPGTSCSRPRRAAARLVAGHVLTLAGGPRDDINQRWLLVEVRHELRHDAERPHGVTYVARFTAVPASGGYRPARPTRPHPWGVQTATVTGAAGAELHTEAHGRVTTHLRWDRRSAKDDKSSHWMRVAQPSTSGGFFLPACRLGGAPRLLGCVGGRAVRARAPGQRGGAAFGSAPGAQGRRRLRLAHDPEGWQREPAPSR